MMQVNIRRCLSLMLALVLTFSLLPVPALAEEAAETIAIETTSLTEATEAPTEAPVETTVPVTEDTVLETTVPAMVVEETAPVVAAASNNKDTVQAAMDAIVSKYLDLTKVMTAEDVAQAVADMDDDTWFEALIKVEDLENSDAVQALTEEELLELTEKNPLFCAFADAVYERATMPGDAGLYATVKVLDGQVSITDTENTVKNNNGTITATAKGGLLSKTTNTVTITNETTSKAALTFNYAASTYNSFTVDGATASASGVYSGQLEAGSSVKVVIKSNSGFSNLTATLTLSNFSLVPVSDSANVTIQYNSTLGSVEAAGNVTSNDDTVQNVSTKTGVELVAKPASGSSFLGWVYASDNSVISTSASFTYIPATTVTIKAVFTGSGSAPHWGVGAAVQKSVSSGLLGMSKINYHQAGVNYIFDDLKAAIAKADTSNNTITLLNDATLPAGDYTIPADVTLLIPFDADKSLYTTTSLNTGTYTKPTAYRTLTMADGANLTINGAMSLSAKHRYAQGNKTDGASPTGDVSFVRMQGDSNITINNGGALYSYGFITGSGSVTANSGAIIYELFQFMDFRGGTQSTDMDNGVFPLSQYYVQNIEVPMTIYSGAKEFAGTTIYMSSADFTSNVNFISNSDAMFNLTSGYAIKKYDGTTDRLKIDLFGDTTISSVAIKVSTSSINSKDYELPLNGNITITVHSGAAATINQDLAVLPGAEIYVEEKSTITIGSGKNIYVYDADEWGTFCGAGNKTFIPLTYAPGRTHTRTEAELKDAEICVDGTVDASAGYIYTTAGGANIYSTGTGVVKINPGEQTITHQLVQNTGYTNITITSAKLKNADGSFTLTENAVKDKSGTYTYTNGFWICNEHTEVIDEAVAPQVGKNGLTEGKHCSVCNTVTLAQQLIPALYGGVIYGTNIRAGDSLDLYFYISKKALKDRTDLTAEMVSTKIDPETNLPEEVTTPFAQWEACKVNGEDYFRVVYENIAAKEMTDIVTITIYDTNGYQFSEAIPESIRNYATRAFKTENGELMTMMADMLNYGAAAQQYFGYKTGDLANKYNTGANAVAGSTLDTDTISDDIKWLTDIPQNCTLEASVVLEANLIFNFYFKGLKEGTKAVATYTDHYNTEPPHRFEAIADLNNLNLNINGMAAADGSQIIVCELFDENNLSIGKVQASVEGYVHNVLGLPTPEDATEAQELTNLKTLCTELMKYINSAYAYFH